MNSQEPLLPFATATAVGTVALEPTAPDLPECPAARPMILVIDDEAYLRTFLRMALERAGYAVTEAADGREGMRLFAALLPSCVIADMRMPEKDGIETVMEIRRHRHQAPIIAISGGLDAYTPVCLKTARQLGADAALHKPFSVDELLDVVATLVPRNPAATGG